MSRNIVISGRVGMQLDTYWDTEVELGQLQGGPEDVVRWFAGMW